MFDSMRQFEGVKGGLYYLVQTMDQFWEFYAEFEKQKLIAVDTETSGFDWNRQRTCGIVVGWGVEYNFYLPIRHQTTEDQLDIELIRDPLKKVFEDPTVVTIFWNEKFDRHFLRADGLEVCGIRHDGVVLAHLLDENKEKALKKMALTISKDSAKWEKIVAVWRADEAKRRRHEFNMLVKERLALHRDELEERLKEVEPLYKFQGYTKPQITAKLKRLAVEEFKDHPLAKNKKDDISYDYIPLEIITPYACADVHYTFLLYKNMVLQVAGHDDLRHLYVNEMRLSDLLFEVEHAGMKIDVPYLQGLKPEYERDIAELEQTIYKKLGENGEPFNINSNQQLVTRLQAAGVRLTKLTKKGKELANAGQPVESKHYSVDSDTLEYLASKYEVAKDVQELRKKLKLLNTYIIKLVQLVDEDWFVHSTFNANVVTGRMSSRNPNCQNIPSREKAIRQAFTIPERRGLEHHDPEADQWLFVAMDYSQVELRLTAHHSQDGILLAAYPFNAPSQDVHSITCAEAVMGISLDEFTKVYSDESNPLYPEYDWFRKIAKRVNFGIIYGAGPGAIQRQVSTPDRLVTKEECEMYIDKYFNTYPDVKEWIDRTTYTLNKTGYLQNSFGRFRRLIDSSSQERWKKERAGRQGVNFLIQGDAADLFKTAAVRVQDFLERKKARTSIRNFVHDEIQFYWHKNELDLIPQVRTIMEDFPRFSVPIVVDIEVSRRDWASAKELKI